MRWGIPVPAPDADGKVLYVWFEAVLGYISATKEWAEQQGTPDAWKTWWRDADTNYTAFLGKDNIVFHTIIFPILLHSREEDGYILPYNVPANEFLNLEGQKFSKSRNWAIDLVQYLADFPEPQHSDILRYVLTMNMPETRDSDFTWRDVQARTNNELAAILGNYVNRVAQFTHKQFSGAVPAYGKGPADADEEALNAAIENGITAVAKNLDTFRFRDAATEAMNVARAANKYFNDRAPWKAIKEDADSAARTLHVCLQTIRTLSVLFAPFLPNTSAAMQKLVGVAPNAGAPGEKEVGTDTWAKAGVRMLKEGTEIADPKILFTRVEDEVVEKMVAQLGPEEKQEPMISFEDFMNVKLRTARVVSAEPVKKSNKLLKLVVDLGTEQRQVIAGIAKHYQPEDLVGKMVVVVANLKSAKLMGLESQGMILAASNEDGKLTLVSPMDDEIGPGAEVR